jgi:hypothetical protein
MIQPHLLLIVCVDRVKFGVTCTLAVEMVVDVRFVLKSVHYDKAISDKVSSS